MKPVRTKKDFVARYMAGEFGNASPSWPNFKAYWADRHKPKSGKGLIHFRNRLPGGKTYYNIDPAIGACRLAHDLTEEGTIADYYISEMAPSEKTLIQGEIEGGFADLYLTYNQQKLAMRDGFDIERKIAVGIKAKLLLQHYMDPNSWEWLNHLRLHYVDHVIEFSTYAVEWGTLPHYNTVFWEVRQY